RALAGRRPRGRAAEGPAQRGASGAWVILRGAGRDASRTTGRATVKGLAPDPTAVDVSSASNALTQTYFGEADRSSSAVWFAPSGSCRCGRRAASRLPPRRAPPYLEYSSSLSQTVPPCTSLLPDGSLAPVLSEELSCDARCWRSS